LNSIHEVTLHRHMKKIILAIGVISLGMASCNKEPQPLTKTEIKQKVDSIATARIKELDIQAQKDLEYRITIEVKVKADSILNAKMQPKKQDSVLKAAVKKVNKMIPQQ